MNAIYRLTITIKINTYYYIFPKSTLTNRTSTTTYTYVGNPNPSLIHYISSANTYIIYRTGYKYIYI